VRRFRSDSYGVYPLVLAVGNHYQGKGETIAPERTNVLRDNQNHARCDNQASLVLVSVVQQKLHPGIMMSGRQADVKLGPLAPRLWRLRA
jgi:hypothetical protein